MRALLQISASPEKKLAYDIVHANPSWRDDGVSGVLGWGGHHERDPNLRFNSLEEKEKLLSCLKFAVKKAINLESYRKLPFWFASENLGVTQQFVDRLLHKALFHSFAPYIRGMPVANGSVANFS